MHSGWIAVEIIKPQSVLSYFVKYWPIFYSSRATFLT